MGKFPAVQCGWKKEARKMETERNGRWLVSGAQDERTPPHSIEAEEYVLACCLLDNGVTLGKCIGLNIEPTAFYSPANRIVYEKSVELYGRGIPVEYATLREELASSRHLEEIGGDAFLVQITGRAPTTANAAHFICTLRDRHAQRCIIKTANSVIDRCYDHPESASELLVSFQTKLSDIVNSASTVRKGFTIWRPSDFAAHTLSEDDAILGEGETEVYWREKQVALLLGPGGVGKSRLAINLARAQILQLPFVGFKTFGPPRRWLLCGNEVSVRRYKEELASITRDCTDEQRALLDSHLFIQALVGDDGDTLSLDDPKALSLWRATAAIIKPDVGVIDPWEAVIIGGDCNDASATRESIRVTRAMFSPHSDRFTLLIVHHAREGAEAARRAEGFDAGAYAKGSKTLRSISRFAINVAPEDPEDGGRVVLACGKINDGKKFSTRGAILDDETKLYSLNHDFDLDAWRDDVEGKRREVAVTIADCVEAVRSVYRNGEDVQTSAIVNPLREQTGASAKTIQRRLKDALQGGYLRSGSKRGTWRLGSKPLKP